MWKTESYYNFHDMIAKFNEVRKLISDNFTRKKKNPHYFFIKLFITSFQQSKPTWTPIQEVLKVPTPLHEHIILYSPTESFSNNSLVSLFSL